MSADESRIFAASGDGKARVWETATGNLLKTLEGRGSPMLAIAINSSATLAATGSWDGVVEIWNLENEQLASRYSQNSSAVFGIAFHPNDRQIVSASRD